MGSLDKSNHTSVDLESEHATTSNGNESTVRPTFAHDESIQLGSTKRLISFTSCPSSISSDYSLEDPLQDFDTEHDKSSLKLDEVDDPLATEHDENLEEQSSDSEAPSSVSSPPANDYNSESPPIQVMERPESSKYRIPSHVFARRNSSTPGDWSMASNESLFSIQIGGTSFCNPELALGYGAEDYIFSPQLYSPYDNQLVGEAGNSNELDGEYKIHDFGDVHNQESNMLDKPTNLNDKEDRQSTADQELISHLHAESSSSSKSFMFPILAGETEKGSSPNPHGSAMGVSEEPNVGPSPQSPSNPETSEAKAETKQTTPLVAWTTWFPCFRYCTCCS